MPLICCCLDLVAMKYLVCQNGREWEQFVIPTHL